MEEQQVHEIKVVDKRFTENEIVPAKQTDLIMTAIQNKYQPEFIEKMMALQERFEANEARKAYHQAMAEFKKEPPKILRDKDVEYTAQGKKAKWSHADLGVAAAQINKSLSENDLNSTWKTEQLENGNIKVTCIITHKYGHSEETFLIAPPDTSGSKNAIQAIGSTVFYLERYTLFAATGIAPVGMDDDGQTSGAGESINDQQFSSLTDMMNEVQANEKGFLKFFKIDNLGSLPAKRYDEAWEMLEAKKK